MNSRRQFLRASAATALSPLIRTRANTSAPYPYSEFERRIARRDFQGMTKDVLPTPCMLVDLDLFEQNVRKMADHSKSVGINVRPHVKVHKSVEVAKRQIALGAIGLTATTIAEAELMSGSGCAVCYGQSSLPGRQSDLIRFFERADCRDNSRR